MQISPSYRNRVPSSALRQGDFVPQQVTAEGLLHIPPPLQGTEEGDFIGIFKVSANGNTVGKPCQRTPSGFKRRERYIAVASPSTFGSVATMTSSTSPFPTRSNSSLIFSLSGVTPFIGEISPCRT